FLLQFDSGQGGAYSLCEVCNLQLASPAQAQLHYNGRSHLRRVRQLQARETGQQAAAMQTEFLQSNMRSTESACSCEMQTRPLLVQSPDMLLLSGLQMKPFLPFPVETSSPVGIFPNFNTMDPVQKAVINHTFGVSLVPKKKQVISCNVCQLRFNSDSQAEAHYRGSRHAKKLKSQEKKTKAKLSIPGGTNGSITSPVCPAPPVSSNSSTNQLTGFKYFKNVLITSPLSSLQISHLASLTPFLSNSRPGSEPPPSSPPTALPAPEDATVESEEEKAKKLLYCSLCKVAVNSLSQLEAHNAGSKHKTMLEARSGAGPIKAYPRAGAKLKSVSGTPLKGSGLQNKTFHCQICDVHVNSEIQLKQHISSRRHKDRVAGKPSKPKYSPYNKQPRSSLTLLYVLNLCSVLCSPFYVHLLVSPVCNLFLSSLLLFSSIISSAVLGRSWMRPAPGPIRASQGSIVFTPY
uniref:C2H2-type domain-containing protein n=1 Tax=Gasterosteus aculeatus TaxID=69293 RepID=G3NBK0_GASAC